MTNRPAEYRVSVRGKVPANLDDRISQWHADAILARKGEKDSSGRDASEPAESKNEEPSY